MNDAVSKQRMSVLYCKVVFIPIPASRCDLPNVCFERDGRRCCDAGASSLAREEERRHDRDSRDAEYHADGGPADGLGHVEKDGSLETERIE